MPTTETRRLHPALMWLIFLAVVATIGFTIHALTRDLVEVRVADVTRQNLIQSVATNGKVEPLDKFQAAAPAPGVIAKVYVQQGQKVRAGQLLLKLDDADIVSRVAAANATLSTAQANMHDISQGGTQEERIGLAGDLKRAQMQKQQATNDLSAIQELQQKGASSASEVAAAQQRLQSDDNLIRSIQLRSTGRYSSADRSRAEAQLADAKAAVSAAQSSYAANNIRAPFAGTVYSIPVSDSDFAQLGENLLDMADLTKIQIRAYFDEPTIGGLAVGQPVKIVWDAKPNQTWNGHVTRVPTTVTPYGTRNVGECLITVDDSKGDLLPSTNVTVTVTTSQRFNVLTVPREAFHNDSGGDFVYRVVKNKLVRTPIQIGLINLTRVEIVRGLTEKDIVALSALNSRELINGLAVKVVE